MLYVHRRSLSSDPITIVIGSGAFGNSSGQHYSILSISSSLPPRRWLLRITDLQLDCADVGPLSMDICTWHLPFFAILITSSANPSTGPQGPIGLSSSNLLHKRIASAATATRSPWICWS